VLTNAPIANGVGEHRDLFDAAAALDEQAVITNATLHLGRTVKSALGDEALATMVERVGHARGLAAPVLEALMTLV
jgi:hypothetical protein